MDQQAATDKATAPASGGKGGAGMTPEQVDDRRLVTLNLSTGTEAASCPFWVAIAKSGPLPPQKLLDESTHMGMFELAATTGIADDEVVVLADTQNAPARFVTLMPPPPREFRGRTLWIEDLIKTLKSWNPQAMGVYVSPELLPGDDGLVLTQDIIRAAIGALPTGDFYLLTDGLEINAVVNAAIGLKSELQGDRLNLYVFH